MKKSANLVRLLVEILCIVGLTEVLVMLALPALVPGLTGLGEGLVDVALLVLVAGPLIYLRSLAALRQAAARSSSTSPSPHQRMQVRTAVALAIGIQVVGLVLMGIGMSWLKHYIDTAGQTRFDRGAEHIESEIVRRFNHPLLGLKGARGAFAMREGFDRSAFRAYVDSHNLPIEFPGVLGFGYIERVARADLQAFVDVERADGAPDFAVKTQGHAPDLFVVKYIEPLAANRPALGFDVGQEAVRREAAERAVATGQPALTGTIALVQSGVHSKGFLYFLPVYRRAVTAANGRSDTLAGLLYAPFTAVDLLQGVIPANDPLFDFELFEGDGTRAEQLIYDADGKPNLRTHDPDYLNYVGKYLRRVNAEVRDLFADRGGPIVLYSVENEYNWFQPFHEGDKLFGYQGGPERGLLQTFNPSAYFTALRDIVRNDGITVPITTCPGDGKASATGDVAGVVPVPNIYNGLGGDYPEKTAVDLLSDMHSSNHGGVYANMPSGTTETDRDPVKIKRMFLGGLDAAFAFNAVGMMTPGYKNAIVLNTRSVDNAFDFSAINNIMNGFVSPQVGYFSGVIDYYGPISPSGLLRPSFHAFRRDNLFLNFLAEQGKDNVALGMLLEEFNMLRGLERQAMAALRRIFKHERYANLMKLLLSVPGVGFLTAVQLLTEIGDMKRFKKFDELCFYVGLIPGTQSSGETVHADRRTSRGNKHLRTTLIESAWVAIRQDPELALTYSNLKKRMDGPHAIIKIARKLLNRIRRVWLSGQPYSIAIAE